MKSAEKEETEKEEENFLCTKLKTLSDQKFSLSISSLIFPYFEGDPLILYNELYPQIQRNKESLREIKRV